MGKRFLSVLLMFIMLISFSGVINTEAAVKISKKKATMEVDSVLTLKITGTNNTVKWKTSDKKIATVKKGKVTAKAEGKATITATVGSSKYTCEVTVVDSNKEEVITPTPTPTHILKVDTSGFNGVSGDGFLFSVDTNSGLTHLSRVKFTKVDYSYKYVDYTDCFDVTINYTAQCENEIESQNLTSGVDYWFSYKVYDSEDCVIESSGFGPPKMYMGEKTKSSFKFSVKADCGERIRISVSVFSAR